jgi:hypothetical protein
MLAAVVLIVVTGVAIGLAQTVGLRPGRYANTVTVEFQDGAPEGPFKSPAETEMECITPAALKDLPTQFFKPDDYKACTVADQKTGPGRLAVTMKCTGPDDKPSELRVDMTYQPESFKSVVTMKDTAVTTIVRMSAKRVGDCAK